MDDRDLVGWQGDGRYGGSCGLIEREGVEKIVSKKKSTGVKRTKKPLIEKRRRDRMNRCLENIKQLVLAAKQQAETSAKKMEKADILEMTQDFLQSVLTRPGFKAFMHMPSQIQHSPVTSTIPEPALPNSTLPNSTPPNSTPPNSTPTNSTPSNSNILITIPTSNIPTNNVISAVNFISTSISENQSNEKKTNFDISSTGIYASTNKYLKSVSDHKIIPVSDAPSQFPLREPIKKDPLTLPSHQQYSVSYHPAFQPFNITFFRPWCDLKSE